MPNAHILIVDDEPDIRAAVSDILQDEGYSVALAEDAAAAQIQLQARRADLILLDVWMPNMDGLALLRHWHSVAGNLPAPVVMMSGHGTLETAVEAIRLGAYDFIEKPLSLDKLLLTVENTLQTQRLAQENSRLRRENSHPSEPLGDSTLMQTLKAQAKHLAESDTWLLLRGEPGSGRQSFARYIHHHSARRHQPFVVVNAATQQRHAVGHSLLGQEDLVPPKTEGASALQDKGAERRRVRYGLLEQAHGGTLFIAELGELDKREQTQLLHVLTGGSFTRNGGTHPVEVDVRVIAATALDLREEVNAGRLRDDLYQHISAHGLVIPPLCAHAEDVPLLLNHTLRRAHEHDGAPLCSLDAEAMAKLCAYPWPGHVGELKNVVQRLLMLSQGGNIGVAEAQQALGGRENREMRVSERDGWLSVDLDLGLPLREARDDFERAYLEAQLRHSRGSMTELARRAGMERTNLYRKLKMLGVKDTFQRDDSDE
ncbi:MAG: sigma-54 dependent transcriptional regulator [Halothiobacillaceae bacterium]|nr:sigma-54 dependent transcriptional regulator [Halothiobacillaceae bacterium]